MFWLRVSDQGPVPTPGMRGVCTPYVGCEAQGKSQGLVTHPLATGEGKAGRVKTVNP